MDYKDGQSASLSSSSSSESFQPNPNIEISEPPLVSEKRKTGRKIFKETRHPIYKGVRQRNGNKWVCEVREPNKRSRIWLGTFPTPEMAARAHDVAALALRGESALLNFQDSAWLLERAKSCSPNDIQVAALAGAMLFRPPDTFSQAEIRSRKEFMRPSAINAPNVEEEEEEEEECETVLESSRRMYVDEEELFNMPGLIDSMAEGMVITPPAMKRGFRWGGTGCEDIYLTNLWRDQ